MTRYDGSRRWQRVYQLAVAVVDNVEYVTEAHSLPREHARIVPHSAQQAVCRVAKPREIVWCAQSTAQLWPDLRDIDYTGVVTGQPLNERFSHEIHAGPVFFEHVTNE